MKPIVFRIPGPWRGNMYTEEERRWPQIPTLSCMQQSTKVADCEILEASSSLPPRPWLQAAPSPKFTSSWLDVHLSEQLLGASKRLPPRPLCSDTE